MSHGETVLILGATGMVGGHALEHALAHPQVKEVRTLGRRKLTQEHPKLRQWVAADLEKLDDEACFQGVTVCLFCVGAYTGALDSDAFRRINVDLPLTMARTLQRHSPDARFALLSGQGADRSEKSRVQFARDKGAAENQLAALGLGGFATFRPEIHLPRGPQKRAQPGVCHIPVDLPADSASPQVLHPFRRLGQGHGGSGPPADASRNLGER